MHHILLLPESSIKFPRMNGSKEHQFGHLIMTKNPWNQENNTLIHREIDHVYKK